MLQQQVRSKIKPFFCLFAGCSSSVSSCFSQNSSWVHAQCKETTFFWKVLPLLYLPHVFYMIVLMTSCNLHLNCYYIKFRVRTTFYSEHGGDLFSSLSATQFAGLPLHSNLHKVVMGIHSPLQCGHSWWLDKIDNKFAQ